MSRHQHFLYIPYFLVQVFFLSVTIVVLETMFLKTSAVSDLHLCMWFLYTCALHACMRFKERGIGESAKQSKRLETGWGMRGWIWLRVWNGWKGLWCRTFSIEHSWVQAGTGSTTTGRLVPEGVSVKKDIFRINSRSGFTLSPFVWQNDLEDDPLIQAYNESCGSLLQCSRLKVKFLSEWFCHNVSVKSKWWTDLDRQCWVNWL